MEENRTTGYKNASDRKKRNIICLNVYYTLLLIAFCVCYPYMLLHRTSYEKLFGTSDPIISKIIIYTLFGIGILIGYWVFQYAERKRISVETKEKYDNNDDISESFVSTSARREKLKNKKRLYFNTQRKNLICFFGIGALDILLCYLLLMCFDTESIAIIFACSGILIDCFWLFYAERKRIMAKIAQNYDMVSEFSCGLACVGKDGKWGFINRGGDVVIPLKYDSAVWFTEKLAMVEIQGKYGFINKQGLKAISFIFDKATPFYKGKALVEKYGKPFYIDTKGRYVENKANDAFRLSKEEASAFLPPKGKIEVWAVVVSALALFLLVGLGLFVWFQVNRNTERGTGKAVIAPKTFTVGNVNFTMVPVQGGTFRMGATIEQGSDAYDWEKPAHWVTLSDYYIGETEVTQALWQAVTGTAIEQQCYLANPEYSLYGVGPTYPMYYVSWDDAQKFITKLNEKTGKHFALPTEAQWEFAARGGNLSHGYKYAGKDTIGDVAWYHDNAYNVGSNHTDYGTHVVKTKRSNELGLYDMSGNVWEWCSDWWSDDYTWYNDVVIDPEYKLPGSYRVLRGGSWNRYAQCCRVSDRIGNTPDNRDHESGFRLVLLP